MKNLGGENAVPKERREKRKADDEEQSRRFLETARALESDESGEAFEEAMDRLAGSEQEGCSDRTKQP